MDEQVRITDLMGSRTTDSSIPLKKEIQKDKNQEQPHLSAFGNNEPSDIRATTDLSYPKSSAEISEDVEDGKGVLYCELDVDNRTGNEDKGEEEKIDKTIPV